MIAITPDQFLACQHGKDMFWCSVKDRKTGKNVNAPLFTTNTILIDDVPITGESFVLASSSDLTCTTYGRGFGDDVATHDIVDCIKKKNE